MDQLVVLQPHDFSILYKRRMYLRARGPAREKRSICSTARWAPGKASGAGSSVIPNLDTLHGMPRFQGDPGAASRSDQT